MIWLQLIWAILAIIQAAHNFYSFEIDNYQDPNYKEYNGYYHTLQLIREVAITGLLAIYTGELLIFPILLGIRFIFFQYSLNIIRGKNLFYLSDRGTDKIIKDTIGSKGVLILSIIGVIILNYYMLRTV